MPTSSSLVCATRRSPPRRGAYPGYKIQLNLKHLDDDAVDAAHARALALVPALRALGASEGVIEWRARDRNHEQAVDFARP